MKDVQLEQFFQKNTLTLGRAFLATSSIVTLLFTGIEDLFPSHHILELRENREGVMLLNFFLWFETLTVPYVLSIIVLSLVLLGIYPRYFCLVHAWVAYSVFYTMLIVEGGDQINAILTLLVIPLCVLDSRKNAWKITDKPIKFRKGFLYYNAKYSLLFIGVQMSVLYFNAGVSKIFTPEWVNGTAVYYWFFDNTFGAPNWLRYVAGPLFKNNVTVTIINWSVIILELFLFIGLFLNQRHKYFLFALGILFHLVICIVHGLFTFSLAMMGGLVLFYFQLDKSITENLNLTKSSITQILKEI